MFGKIAEHTAKTNVLISNEIRVLTSTWVRTNIFGPNGRTERPFGASLEQSDMSYRDDCPSDVFAAHYEKRA